MKASQSYLESTLTQYIYGDEHKQWLDTKQRIN